MVSAHCSRSNKLAAARQPAACAESPAPSQLVQQSLFQQILGEHVRVFAVGMAAVVAVVQAGMEQPDREGSGHQEVLLVSKAVVVELAVVAAVLARRLGTAAFVATAGVDIAAFVAPQQHFAPEDLLGWQYRQFLLQRSAAQSLHQPALQGLQSESLAVPEILLKL